jgi:hypothetical protein
MLNREVTGRHGKNGGIISEVGRSRNLESVRRYVLAA